MTIGLRAIFLIGAIILFLFAAISDENTSDLISIGLALVAAALLVEELGVGNKMRFTREGPVDRR